MTDHVMAVIIRTVRHPHRVVLCLHARIRRVQDVALLVWFLLCFGITVLE